MKSSPAFDLTPFLLIGTGIVLGFLLVAISPILMRLRSAGGRRRPKARWIVIPVFACALLAIALLWLLYTPVYCATAVLRISPTSQTILFEKVKQETPRYQVFVNTEVSVMAGPTVQDRVLDQPDIRATRWYKDTLRGMQSGKGGELSEKFQEAIAVEPRRGTELIDISFSATDPSDARLIANAVVSQYKKLRDGEDKQGDDAVTEILTTEQASLQMEIDGLVKTRFQVSSRLGTDSPEQLRSILTQQMNLLEDRIHEKQRQQEMKNWELVFLKNAASQPATGPGGAAAAKAPESIAQLDMDTKRLALESSLLEKDLEKQRARVKEAGDVAQEIANYDERIRQKRELYEAVRQHREHLEMEHKAPARVRVVALAMDPFRPCDDTRPGVTLAILIAAACLSLLLLAFRPVDNTVQADQMQLSR